MLLAIVAVSCLVVGVFIGPAVRVFVAKEVSDLEAVYKDRMKDAQAEIAAVKEGWAQDRASLMGVISNLQSDLGAFKRLMKVPGDGLAPLAADEPARAVVGVAGAAPVIE